MARKDGKLALGAREGLVIRTFANHVNVLLGAIAWGAVVIPRPLVANLAARDAGNGWVSNCACVDKRFGILGRRGL